MLEDQLLEMAEKLLEVAGTNSSGQCGSIGSNVENKTQVYSSFRGRRHKPIVPIMQE